MEIYNDIEIKSHRKCHFVILGMDSLKTFYLR